MYADFRIQLDCLAFFKPQLHINASIAYQCKGPLNATAASACSEYLNSIARVCASGNSDNDFERIEITGGFFLDLLLVVRFCQAR